MVSAEDAILSKLEWAKESRPEPQLRDVVAMLRAQRETLAMDSLKRWAVELGVNEMLDRALADAS